MAQIPTKDTRTGRGAGFFTNCALLAVSIVFFALPQPNFLSDTGFPLLAYIAFVPLFVLVRRISFRSSFIWGALYGLFSYSLFAFWLAIFHPVAPYVIGAIYFFYLMLVLPALKLADMLFPRNGFVVQWMVWVGYEYVKTLGFNAFAYGIIGYSQWSWPVIIQIASIFGVWGVSALVTFPSAWIAGGLKDGCEGPFRTWFSGFPAFARSHAVSAVVWCVALAATILFGLVSPQDYTDGKKATIALVQPNSDPWKGGFSTYRRDFITLTRLSDEALASNPDIDLVVWPETGFIPRIDWHYKYREDQESFELVSMLLEYLDKAPVPFVLGNDDAVKGRTYDGMLDRVDYNAVLVFTPGKNVIPPAPDKYRKLHLVPYTEHFPYRKQFPLIYDLLASNDVHFWEKGTDPTVFDAGGLKFSTPICFEDTFGNLSRDFVNNGALAIVNLTNDAWAKSAACQYQHLSMSVFRAVENRVPLVRSTASGQTSIVDPNGKVTAMAKPFTETWLVGQIPVLTENPGTLYNFWGDLWGMLFASVAALAIIGGLLTKLHDMHDN